MLAAIGRSYLQESPASTFASESARGLLRGELVRLMPEELVLGRVPVVARGTHVGAGTPANFRPSLVSERGIKEALAGVILDCLKDNDSVTLADLLRSRGVPLSKVADVYRSTIGSLESLGAENAKVLAHLDYVHGFFKEVIQQVYNPDLYRFDDSDYTIALPRDARVQQAPPDLEAPRLSRAQTARQPGAPAVDPTQLVVSGVLGNGASCRPSKWYSVLKALWCSVAWVGKLFGFHPLDGFERWKARRIDLGFVANKVTVLGWTHQVALRDVAAGDSENLRRVVMAAMPKDTTSEFQQELAPRVVAAILTAMPA